MSDELSNAIFNLIKQDSLPPENVIQVIKLYLKDDRVVQSSELMGAIIMFYLKNDLIDVWSLIGTQYISYIPYTKVNSIYLKEVNFKYLESFEKSFRPQVKKMIEIKKLQKKLHQIDF